MSIVEKALQKLQGASAAAAKPATPVASPVAARVIPVEQSPRAQPQRRTQIGGAQKTVHLDFDRLRLAGLLPPEHQQRELAHQYRTIKRPVIRYAFDTADRSSTQGAQAQRSIMVSSALPGDGKTFTSLNLALSISLEKDFSVLLVDGDVPKAHLSDTFGLRDEPGLLDALNDPALDVESVVVPTNVRGLSLLPVGRRTENATELLASARMRQIVTTLQDLDPNLIVIVDSPPILLTSEARVLASLFPQVLLVVRASTTPQHAVTEAVKLIGDGPRICLVLNQAYKHGPADAYGYYGEYYGIQPSDMRSEGTARNSNSGVP